MQLKVPLLISLVLVAHTVVAATAIAAPRQEAGERGALRYWEDGHCIDARGKKETKDLATGDLGEAVETLSGGYFFASSPFRSPSLTSARSCARVKGMRFR